jgi:acetyl-CoA carboxylase beta subunit
VIKIDLIYAVKGLKILKLNTLVNNRRKDIPDGIWAKCPECSEIIYNGELDRNARVCLRCSYYFPIDPSTRISLTTDERSFHRYNDVLCSDKENCDRIIMSGKARLLDHNLVIMALNLSCKTDSIFVTENIVNTISHAIEQKLPMLVIYTVSGNGGNESNANFPAQTLNISANISRLSKNKLLYVSVLSQSVPDSFFPSYAYSADVVIAESNSLGTSHTGSRIGRRDADRAIQSLFQSGVVDMIVSRDDLKNKLADVFSFFG